MKILIVVVAALFPSLASSSTIQSHFSHVPLGEIVRAVVKTCARKTGATEADIARLHDFENLDRTRESKCMNACSLETYGTLDEEGKPVNSSLDLYYAIAYEPEEHDKVANIWSTCYNKTEKNSDSCEYGDSLVRCFIESVKAAGLKQKQFW